MNTRTVEVIRVGTIGLDINYPGKQIVRLRDVSGLYEGGPLRGLADAKKKIEAFEHGKQIKITENRFERIYDDDQLEPALSGLANSVEDFYNRLRGKTLSGVNVDIWDQISGAYLGGANTDENGTLVLPTDKEFVEVIQWKLAGGGYSDCFNGEPAAGMPGLFFYFPCNEGGRSSTIASFPGVSGQQVDMSEMTTPWEWYTSGFFNRPALKVISDTPQPLELIGAEPIGLRSFQFLWYCSDPAQNRTIFSYSTEAFSLGIENGVLRGSLFGQAFPSGTTQLQAGKWYLIQINTLMIGGWNPMAFPDPAYEYWLTMKVYLGGTLELSIVPDEPFSGSMQTTMPGVSSLVFFSGIENDGFDEIRHLDRELYESEIADYAAFLKQGRVAGKSKGSLGSVGW